MKKIYIVLILLIFFLQFAFLPNFFWNISVPNLLLIIAICIGCQKSFEENLGWFLGAGFLFEIFSSGYLGSGWLFFVFFGILTWFFQNFVISKERNFLIEIFFWFVAKITWDILWAGVIFTTDFFQEKNNLSYNSNFFNSEYFLEIIIFILSGVLIFKLVSIVESKFDFFKK
jgi:hypothetical protein